MARTITPVLGNSQKLDGGSMFGNCPRAVWERWLAPDAQGRVPLACRAMLVRDGDRRILFEAGIGAFFEPKLANVERVEIVKGPAGALYGRGSAGGIINLAQ